MKKCFCLLLTAAMLFVCCGAFADWMIVEDGVITKDAAEVLETAAEKDLPSALLQPVTLLAAHSNNKAYCVLCLSLSDDDSADVSWVQAYVERDDNGECSLLDLQPVRIGEANGMGEYGNLLGGLFDGSYGTDGESADMGGWESMLGGLFGGTYSTDGESADMGDWESMLGGLFGGSYGTDGESADMGDWESMLGGLFGGTYGTDGESADMGDWESMLGGLFGGTYGTDGESADMGDWGALFGSMFGGDYTDGSADDGMDTLSALFGGMFGDADDSLIAGEAEETEAVEEDGQNPFMNLIGNYVAADGGRAEMMVECTGDSSAHIVIHWANSASECYEWDILCDYAEPTIRYTDAKLLRYVFNNSGVITETETVYENGTGTIRIQNNYDLIWTEKNGDEHQVVFTLP